MAVQTKLTIKRGQKGQNVTVAAGTSIAGSDAMELNIDATVMSKGDALQMIDELQQYILRAAWTPA